MKNVGTLKNVYIEQLNKLQQKHQQECDLLEDLRLFAKQRSLIEKEYAQSLSKLAQQFLSKRAFPPLPGIVSEDGKEHKTMHEVWQTVLEETEKVGKIRLQAADIYLQQISEPCKPLRATKSQIAKKVFENLVEIQKDLSVSVQEVTKLQKIYKDEEHLAHDARVKAADADDKVKRKSVGIFTSMSKLQQQSAKLNLRREGCETKSTTARNDYILSISAANAHLLHYYCKDIPELIKSLDGEVYEKMQEFFTLFCQAELHSCGITQECFMKILADSTKVSRQYNLQGFLHDNNVFTESVQYQFQAQDNDQINKVSKEHQCQIALEAEAKKCASRIVKEDRAIKSATKKLQHLQDQVNSSSSAKGQDVPAEGSTTATSAVDGHVKMEELRQAIRKAESEKSKANSRMEALKAAGIPIDDYLTAASAEAFTPEEEEDVTMTAAPAPQKNRTSSVTSFPGGKGSDSCINPSVSEYPEELSVSYAGGGGTTTAANDMTYVNYQEEDDDAFELTGQKVSLTNQTTQHTYPMHCLAIYNFQASNVDELNITEGDQLEIIGDGGAEGWIKARNNAGAVGVVPESYIQIIDATQSVSYGAVDSLQYDGVESVQYGATESVPYGVTESLLCGATESVSYGVTESVPYGSITTAPYGTNETLPMSSDYSTTVAPLAVSEYDATEVQTSGYTAADYEIQATLNQSAQIIPTDGLWAKALYDYYGTCDEELTFPEGQLIQILRKELHDNVDDGWWEGEYNGKIGVFPSLVVEELAQSSKELGSPLRPGPPEFAPPSLDQDTPQLEITHPTPTDDEPGQQLSEKLQDFEDRTMASTDSTDIPQESEKDTDADCSQKSSNETNAEVDTDDIHSSHPTCSSLADADQRKNGVVLQAEIHSTPTEGADMTLSNEDDITIEPPPALSRDEEESNDDTYESLL